jgi:AcrR family transcriptional regulator
MRRRIVDAVIKLHAQQGVTRTTYAMIAKRADVAIPTVYNHFPTISDLLAACGGQVLADAPPLTPEIFATASDLEDRLRTLARAVCAFYRYLAPWLRWTAHEAVLVPDLAARYARMAENRRQLIAIALEPAFGPRPPAALLTLSETLLDFASWQRLTRDRELKDDEVEHVLAEALLALAREHLAKSGADVVDRRAAQQRGRRS